MILDGVDVFVAVVQVGSFGGAARALGMPAATVSAKIARLEERLGVTLIHRTTRTMHVTDAGKGYYAHCADALRALAAGENQLTTTSGKPSGVLRLTASTDGAQQALPTIVSRFLKVYPEVSVEMTVTNRHVDLLAEGIDLALRASPMKDSSLRSRKFASARFALFASQPYLKARGTPTTPHDLIGHDIMIDRRLPKTLTLTSPSGRFELTPRSRVFADDMQTIKALALQGAAMALLPDVPVAARAAGLVPVLPDYMMQHGNLYFVYPASKYTPIIVTAFIDLALERPFRRSATSRM